MIIAIPVKEERIANHFTKADQFIFMDESGEVVGHQQNPARDAGCAGKSALLALLKREQVERVIVRHIGQRMLGRLLDNQFAVFQAQTSRQNLQQIIQTEDEWLPLTDAAQGRLSVNYQSKQHKQQQGGCCEHQHGEGDHAHERCQGHRCCETGVQEGYKANKDEHQHRHGKGRCCRH
ncbi:NifB/NifX family molybdenum-iron cluster-binding protein [Vibrio ruber]|uniref:NifB/NifX family molybdenum-iron cluster-binding protein n=1 Tax=Vibrio ruber TaxID=184755 RepID=UPI002892B255|nr:NifB/NifX family molybdenum-iron cluster-binding protein [Vibrio ruber]WNJ95355.1 NifB/NifX family molybdenum-iron cluster-binding protein [Vibrio ruber]